MKIKFCSAPCGSGKTHQIVEQACQLAKDGERIVVLQPTTELINKTIEQELVTRQDPPPYRAFQSGSDHSAKAPSRQITDFLKSPLGNAGIVFATHQVLPFIPFWPNKFEWHVFVDEELQTAAHHCRTLPDTHALLTDNLYLETYDTIYSRLAVSNWKKVTIIAKNKNEDEIYEQLRDLAQLLLNNHWESFVNTEHYSALISGNARHLSVHSILQPTLLHGFASVTMASANFRDSLVYNLWQRMGVGFEEDQTLSAGLRFRRHANGSLITVKYLTDRSWSKTFQARKLADREKGRVIDAAIEAVKTEFHGHPFLWQANKSLSGAPFGDIAQRLPNIPHGLNDYSQFDRLCFLSALNPRSEHFRFLGARGIDTGVVRRAVYCSAVYQSVMRSSIRDPQSASSKTIIVPDATAAEYLSGVFSGCRIEQVHSGVELTERMMTVGRPRKHGSDKQRVAACRARKTTTKLMKIVDELISHYSANSSCGYKAMEKGCNETPIDITAHFVTGVFCHGSIYASTYSNEPNYLSCENVDWFVFGLQAFHLRSIPRKNKNPLISPAIFDPNHPNACSQKRGLSNIVEVRHLWLDFENGDLTPERLAELFPRTKMVIFNTYNHTRRRPRFRAVFLFNQSLTPNEYETLYDNIVAKIEDGGYGVGARSEKARSSGLDLSKRSPASLFYLPCKAANPSDSFFYDFYHDNSREMLDPHKFIDHSVVQLSRPATRPLRPHSQADEAKVEAATRVWHESINHPGEGNARFWQYAVALRAAGMDLRDIEVLLGNESHNGRNSNERRAQIKSIMISLQRPQRMVA